ncbi:MAG TPA: DUF6057 family protein [Sedimentisphaerales bacterium]|nr:DUF6057 family protein [Sedimentisphaerales bacterium]
MQEINQISAKSLQGKVSLPSLFFIFYFLSVYLIVNPVLIYHGGTTITNFPAFFTGSDFLYKHFANPAEPSLYIYAFIAQFFYFNSTGALVITIQAWLFFIVITNIIKKLNLNCLIYLNYLPPLIILFLYNHYTFHFAALNNIIINLILFLLYIKLPSKTKPITMILAWPTIYYILGPSLAYLAVLCLTYELFFEKNYTNAVLNTALAVIAPYIIGVGYCNTPIKEAYCSTFPFSWETVSFAERKKLLSLIYVLYCMPIVICLLAGVCSIIKIKLKKSAAHTGKPEYNIIAAATVAIIALAVISLAYDKKQKAFFALDYNAYHKNWSKVLYYADQLPFNLLATHQATRALYYTGRLNEDMFKYPQQPHALLFTDNNILHTSLTIFDTYLDLGLINLAEHYLVRNISYAGERDIFIQRLAWINMIKGNAGTAKTYLTALSKTLFQRGWANEQLRAIKQDPFLSFTDNNEIQFARKNKIIKDISMSLMTQLDYLTYLLEANPKNKMAFEYMMAWYLITKNTDKFVDNLGQLRDFGYEQLPTVYQHAILMHVYSTQKEVNMQGFKISPQTIEYAKQFYSVMKQYAGDEQLQLKMLNEKYGDTYFYYYVRKFNKMPKFSGRPE